MAEVDPAKYPLNPLCVGWLEKIKLAEKFKRSHFQEQADEAMKFYECGKELNDLMWRPNKGIQFSADDGDLPSPKFRMVVGKVAEIVQLFGPSLYHRNPTIIVEPKTLDIPLDLLMSLVPPDVMQQAQMAAQQTGQPFNPQSLFPPDPSGSANKLTSMLLQYYLDYIQRENDKKTHSRRMIDEALIKGASICWTETFTPFPGAPKLIGSFYDTIDNLVVDPDCETIEEAWWTARRYVRPVWEVAEEFGIDEEYLRKRATYESGTSQGEREADAENASEKKRKAGKSNDLLEYWCVYSKMGMGHKLSGVNKEGQLEDVEDLLDSFGQNVRICVAKDIPFPLNLHSKKLRKWMKASEEKQPAARKQMFLDVQWPIPFWADGAWPFTLLAFHEVPNNPWPMSHVKPALGYLKFINWAMSFLANKIRTSCRTVIAAAKALEEEWLARLESGKDYEILQVPQTLMQNGTVDVTKLINYVQPPPFQGDIWKVLEEIFTLFDKATGLTEIMYAASGGMRSAQEAQLKQGAMNIRPDDMASKVEDCLSLIARKEAMAARWILDPETVAPIVGDQNAKYWATYVMSNDIIKVAREFNYRIEAGSTRKPNKDAQVATINQAIQVWGPILFPFSIQSGNVQIINAFLSEWCKANDIEEKKFLLPPPPPPPPNPMIQKVQAEIQQGQAELEMKQQESQAKLQFEQQKTQMDLQAQQAKMQADVETARLKIQTEREKAQNDMALKRAELAQKLQLGQMEMQNEAQMMQQKAGLERQAAEHKMSLAERQGQTQIALQQQQGEIQSRQAEQQMAHDAQAGKQELELGKQAHKAKIQQSAEQTKAKVQQSKMQAKAKAKPAAKPKAKGKK